MHKPQFIRIGFNPLTSQTDFAVRLGGETFEYHMGIGCYPAARKPFIAQRAKYIEGGRGERILQLINQGRLRAEKNVGDAGVMAVFNLISNECKPDEKDFMHAILGDMRAGEMTFADFCGDFGYDDDSIKALRTHQACADTARKIRKLFTHAEIETLEKELEGY